MSTIIFHAGLAGVNEREWRTEGEARFSTLLARWNITHHDREPKIQVDTKWEILDVLNSKYLWDTEVKTPSKQQEIQMKIKREVLRRAAALQKASVEEACVLKNEWKLAVGKVSPCK